MELNQIIIAPSILAADFAKLGEEVTAVIEAGANWIHFDVMDNHYVPNLTFGPGVARAIKPYCGKVPLDVHLMVSPVDSLIYEFATAGADYISFHPEASFHIDRSIELIKSYGIKAGLAFNPATPLNYLDYVIEKLDYILIMSVNPGFGGQKFIPVSIEKIKSTYELIQAKNSNIILQVDGGITEANIGACYQAGARSFVAGSSIFRQEDYQKAIYALRKFELS